MMWTRQGKKHLQVGAIQEPPLSQVTSATLVTVHDHGQFLNCPYQRRDAVHVLRPYGRFTDRAMLCVHHMRRGGSRTAPGSLAIRELPLRKRGVVRSPEDFNLESRVNSFPNMAPSRRLLLLEQLRDGSGRRFVGIERFHFPPDRTGFLNFGLVVERVSYETHGREIVRPVHQSSSGESFGQRSCF